MKNRGFPWCLGTRGRLGETAGGAYTPAPAPRERHDPGRDTEKTVVAAVRYLTLVWPGLPWLWLRGSLLGLVLALAFAVTLDAAVLTTWIWPDLVDLPLKLAAWTASVAIWLLGTASALAAFPAVLPVGPDATTDRLLVEARDAYLAHDWLTAERRLRDLLERSPTDGEAQLLLATLLRRVGRLEEARTALDKLSASDAGAPWRHVVARERRLLTPGPTAGQPPHATAETAEILPLQADSPPDARRGEAA